METVFKAAIYEITRLVEESFVEEVLRCREQVESLEKRLKSAESRRKERQDNGKEMCVDCGRVRMAGENKSTVTGDETHVNPTLHPALLILYII
ncbi:hypothetical protein ATANTOWER_029401 [Ataeniobius toweri]|uniref:Uncharacterized protein n=1 Tax=Ataeniobius toweri TaxID=208326 RepID=A0ABU7C423_9TELE|nr:hypothetical protein [Ataeniobius toweri]